MMALRLSGEDRVHHEAAQDVAPVHRRIVLSGNVQFIRSIDIQVPKRNEFRHDMDSSLTGGETHHRLPVNINFFAFF